MREQHGLEMGPSTCRAILYRIAAHANALETRKAKDALERTSSTGQSKLELLAEADGVMTPIVDTS